MCIRDRQQPLPSFGCFRFQTSRLQQFDSLTKPPVKNIVSKNHSGSKFGSGHQLFQRGAGQQAGVQCIAAAVKGGKALFCMVHVAVHLPISAQLAAFAFMAAKSDDILQRVTQKDPNLMREALRLAQTAA